MYTLRKLVVSAYVELVNALQPHFVRSERLYKLLLLPSLEELRWKTGVWRAWRSFDRARKRVPAYREFIAGRGGAPNIPLKGSTPDLTVIPETDKESYVRKYPIESRCVGGRLPKLGVMVDESSGSSGTPTSWVRGADEREVTKHMLRLAYRGTWPSEGCFIINTFALGAWATGLNVSMSLTDIAIIKSTGPDLDKIVNTILEFGPGYRYVVMGYPPFLKTLCDDVRIDWSRHHVDVVFGGEGMSESMRSYLLERFGRVLGSYGASDLEIGMAAENDFTITLRRLIATEERLRTALVREDFAVTPMIFQYNPIGYYIESNTAGELVITLARPTAIAPKIRYNLHDRGHVRQFSEVKAVLQSLGLWNNFRGTGRLLALPLLFMYGRSDMSVDYYGANVTPDSIREILYDIPEVAADLCSFRLISKEDEKHDKHLEIAVELKEDAAPSHDEGAIAGRILSRLQEVNKDFKNAYRIADPALHPAVRFYDFRSGPFEGADRRLKNSYVASNVTYDKL